MRLKTTVAALLIASAASAGEPKYQTNLSLQVGPPNMQGDTHYFGRVGGEHSACVGLRTVRISVDGSNVAFGPSNVDGTYDFLATGPALGARVEASVAATEGTPVCRGVRVRMRHSGL